MLGRKPGEICALSKHNSAVLDLLVFSNYIVSVDRGGSARVWVSNNIVIIMINLCKSCND